MGHPKTSNPFGKLLGWFLHWCGNCWSGWFRRRGSCPSRALDGIGLVVEPHNFLRDVRLRRPVDYGTALRGGVQHGGEAVLTGVAVQHFEHLAADAVDDFA